MQINQQGAGVRIEEDPLQFVSSGEEAAQILDQVPWYRSSSQFRPLTAPLNHKHEPPHTPLSVSFSLSLVEWQFEPTASEAVFDEDESHQSDLNVSRTRFIFQIT